tara:strand:+ start:772 stop:942 length:171 start_codon:yes stop_codon:yes gene_type:complete
MRTLAKLLGRTLALVVLAVMFPAGWLWGVLSLGFLAGYAAADNMVDDCINGTDSDT